MKTLFKTLRNVLVLLLVFASCSKDEDHSMTQSMNPPDWIIGRWLPIDANQPFTNDFIFTEDNVQMSSDGINYLDFNNFGYDDLPGHTYTFYELIISDNAYAFRQTKKYNGETQSDQVYKWTKQTNSTLKFEKWWPESDPNVVPNGTDFSNYQLD